MFGFWTIGFAHSRKGQVLIWIIICTLHWKVISSIWYWQLHFPRSFHNLFVVLMSSTHVIITPDLLLPPSWHDLTPWNNKCRLYISWGDLEKQGLLLFWPHSHFLTEWEQTNNHGQKVFVNPPQSFELNYFDEQNCNKYNLQSNSNSKHLAEESQEI